MAQENSITQSPSQARAPNGPLGHQARPIFQHSVPGSQTPPLAWGPRPSLTCVVEVPGPLIVVGLLGEHGLGHQFLGLVVQAVVQVVPQQQVEQSGLAVRIVPERGCPEPSVQEAARR